MLLTFFNEVKDIYEDLIRENNLFGNNQYIKYALVGFIILQIGMLIYMEINLPKECILV